jgi:predicted Fe-S protein YdhL (DUF1289 family)
VAVERNNSIGSSVNVGPEPEPDVKSPCINICELDAGREFCRGCLRTPDEIFGWPQASRAEKLEILERVAQRKAAAAIHRPFIL